MRGKKYRFSEQIAVSGVALVSRSGLFVKALERLLDAASWNVDRTSRHLINLVQQLQSYLGHKLTRLVTHGDETLS